MNTHNICFINKIRTHITQESLNTPLRKSSAHIPLKCALVRKVFYYFFFSSNFENFSAPCSNWVEYGRCY